YLNKSLLLLHPKYQGVDAASELVGRIERLFGLSVGESAPRLGNVMGVWLDETSVARVGLASHFIARALFADAAVVPAVQDGAQRTPRRRGRDTDDRRVSMGMRCWHG